MATEKGLTPVLDRLAIFKAVDIRIEELFIPEWGGTVYVKGMTAFERDEFEGSLLDQSKKRTKVTMRNARARLAVLCTVTATGERVFTDEDVAALSLKSAAAIDRIYEVAAAMSGIGDDDLEDLLGKSGTTPISDSPSD